VRKATRKRKSVAHRIADGMRELERAMQSDKLPHELFTVRTVQIPDPREYTANAIRNMRSRLHLSQAVFAKLLGVSVELVEHWEQGICAPRPVVRRLFDEINRDPEGFLGRHVGRMPRHLRRAG
jgi:DNA-binding transcriptional regulator YiaG